MNLVDTIVNKLSGQDKITDTPFPCIKVSEGKIVQSNILFDNLIGTQEDIISNLFENIDLNVNKQVIKIGNIFYNVFSLPLHDDEYVLYFTENIYNMDASKIVTEKISVGYIYIDNYEDVLENVATTKQPLLLALLDRRINAFAKRINGVLTKFDKDRYIIFFKEEKLIYLQAKEFDILEQIKNIELDNKIPFTLSIGIGCGDYEFNILAENARAATDLALGRGGDQVVIKDGNKYTFFGGTGKEFTKNSRVKARVKAHILSELISSADNILIMGHKFPDLDCLGACVGVHRIVKSISNINCNIVLNNVTSAINILYDKLVATNEYKNVFIDSKEAIDIVDSKTLVIVCDAYRVSIVECPELLNISKNIVVFDHHRKASDYIQDEVLVYHDSTASSTAELITEMIMYIKNKVNLVDIEADALLAGITVDTKGFTFKTGSKTFEAAAYLKKNGADSHNVHILLQSDRATYAAKSNSVNKAEIYRDTFALSIVPNNVENPKLVVAQTADELLNIVGIKVSFVFCQLGGQIIISARSLGDYNVQTIMEKFGGGGHKTVAAAQITNMNMDDTIKAIKKILENLEV
ncbi:MAG: DHH family phosphoesterase [Lachnospirales bacterium]